jgi:ABC-2 type transport system permease protein
MTTPTVPGERRAAPPSWTMLSIEWRLFMREPVGFAWGLFIPVVAFVVLGCVPALTRSRAYFGGHTFLEVYQPVLIVVSLALLGLNGLPPILAGYRESGVLRRLQATPMPPLRLLGAQLLIHLSVAVAGAALLLGVGRIAFDIGLPSEWAAWAFAYVLSCLAMLSLGVLVAAIASTAKVANTVGTVVFFPIAFFAGLWLPQQSMPHILASISDYTPLGAAIRSMTAAAIGEPLPWAAFAVLAAYGVVFSYLANRWFRWA